MASSSVKPYEWQPLVGDDIRVLTLLPGHFDDDICININHAALLDPDDSSGTRRTRRELQRTLPFGWGVSETVDGRYIFRKWLYQSVDGKCIFHKWLCRRRRLKTTWTHPNLRFDHSLYTPPRHGVLGPVDHAYVALSYVWGSQNDPRHAFVETSSGTSVGTVSIGRNLELALRHLRYACKPRKLWIDAECINQDDDAEKSVQVRRMTRIYRSASRVIAWLGPAKDGSDLAMSTLECVGAQVVATADAMFMPAPGAQKKDWYEPGKELPYGPEIWDALRRLLDREWFTRRWVIQEITLANPTASPHCGDRQVP